MHELSKWTLCELSRGVADKKVSPVELMGATLDRIDEVNGDINAVVVHVDRDQLLGQAREAETRIMAGRARPLEGIPLGVKDLEDAQGLTTSQGSVPFKDTVAKADSTQVARLKAAGAIVIGKTNTPEFGSTATTKNRIFGVTRNPWDAQCTPGGSSGGSSAAVAAQMLTLVTGSDGGGSVRIPACLTGCFGLKPSFGRIPNGPEQRWSFKDTVHQGPITKTVEDAALFLDQVVGAAPMDDNSLPHPGHSYLQTLEDLPAGLRIALSPDLGYAAVEGQVAAAVEQCAKEFEKLGHSLELLEGGPPRVAAAWVYINNVDEYCYLQEMLPQHEGEFGRGFLAGIKEGKDPSSELLEKTFRRRQKLNAWCAQVFDKYDLLITPTMPFDGMPARGPYPAEIDGVEAPRGSPGEFTIPFNFSLHPAATVRAGLSKRGLPMGMQIVAARHRDDLVLQAARAFERERPWHPEWPEL